MWRPRLRFTIRGMMIAVLLVALGVTSFVAWVEHRRLQLARASHQSALAILEVAQIAVLEYEQGIYPQDLATVDAELKQAESDLKRAQDRASSSADPSDRRSLRAAQFALERARAKRDVLTKYTHAKTVKELNVEVDRARREEQARRADMEAVRAAARSRFAPFLP